MRVAILALLLSLVACSGNRRKVVGVVPKATSHLFFVSIHKGVDEAAKEFGLDILWNGPQEETDHSRQIQIIDAMVAQRVDAIAISATDERAQAASARRAHAAGIPVTVFDSGMAFEDYVTFVATDNRAAGETAARLLAKLLHGRGSVAILKHKPGGKSTGDREVGFREVMAREFPQIRIVAEQYGMADRAKSLAAAENILTAHPELDGIFASAEANSIGAIQALKARGKNGKIRLVTFDTSDPHIEALNDGTIDVMLVQDSRRMGYEAVKSLARRLKGETPEKRMDLPVRQIRKEDLGRPEIEKLLHPLR